MKLLLIAALFLGGCASQPCFLELKQGKSFNRNLTPNEYPSSAAVYCSQGAFDYGVAHHSDITRSFPFNDLQETTYEEAFVRYRLQIKSPRF